MYNLKPFTHRLRNVRTLLPGAIGMFATLSVMTCASVASAQVMVDKDTDMQAIYFLDQYALNEVVDMKHRFFQPERVDEIITVDNGRTGTMTYFNASYDPSEKLYKAWYRAGSSDALKMAESTDGIKWKTVSAKGATEGSENTVIYNPFTESWQKFSRTSPAYRRITMSESKDQKTWSDALVILHPGPQDLVGTEFHSMPVFLYEDIFLGLLWKSRNGTRDLDVQWDGGVIEPELAYSYNGVFWNRTFEKFIDRAEYGVFLGSKIHSDSLLVDHEGNIRIYSRVSKGGNDNEESGVVLHKMRKDGFAGLEGFGYEPYLRTKSFILKGGDLTLNINNKNHGSVKVQISDRNGRPYPGFSFEDSVDWFGDDTAYRPVWENKEDISELVGKEIRFEIKMREGILYAIRVPLNPAFVNPPLKSFR